jgi:hypothetical protein
MIAERPAMHANDLKDALGQTEAGRSLVHVVAVSSSAWIRVSPFDIFSLTSDLRDAVRMV